MNGPATSDRKLSFACPHCGGPLTFTADGQVSCEAGHTLTIDDLAVEQTRATARATWLAVRALEDRVKANRWMLDDADAYRLVDANQVRRRIDEDEATARILRRSASMMELSIGVRIEAGHQDGASGG